MQAGKYHDDGSRFLNHDGTPLRGPLDAAASTTAAVAASAFALMAFKFLIAVFRLQAPNCRKQHHHTYSICTLHLWVILYQ
jgi:hypothetical protein